MLTTLPRRIATLAAVAALAIALSACGSSGNKAGASSGSGKSDTISIKNQVFTTGSASAGNTITVANNDSVTHTVTADDGKSFDVQIKAGQTATFMAPATGTYKFHCKIHSNMHGTLTVT
ncbi:MAG TPA: cupredoxin domain-containing protein [Acidimicrobiia bacterium]|jgi:plastocyanin|nr:cupredoxin domain-containing protein [Acidimicrobiia bacterium]